MIILYYFPLFVRYFLPNLSRVAFTLLGATRSLSDQHATSQTFSSLGFVGDALLPTLLIHTLSPRRRLSLTMQAYILRPLYFTVLEMSSGPPRRPEAQCRLKEGSLYPSDCEGLEPRLGLEGC